LLIGLYVQATDDADLRCKLGFFLHIPFPSWDIFRLFPWADEILQGMLGEYIHSNVIPVHAFYVSNKLAELKGYCKSFLKPTNQLVA
jgi:trehalose-6-phosphate synthase